MNCFKLLGWDTFEGGPDAWYPLGSFQTEGEARQAARARLAELERTQPAVTSGGQMGGIQDRVYIEFPDGHRERVR